MKFVKYIFILLFVLGCGDRKFDNPFDPMANKDYEIQIGYSGSELNQLRINNSSIEERSFKCYEIYISKTDNFTPVPENLFLRITNWDSTSVSINSLDENETYYFIVKFVDVLDRTACSEKITVLTANKKPDKPVFSNLTKVYLNQIEVVWYRANIKDFQKYEFYFSELKNFPVTQFNLHNTITNISDTSVFIDNLRPKTEYYYRLLIYDKGNLYSESDEYMLRTENDIPIQVTIENITDATESSLSIRWSRNEDTDFLRYEIHFSTTQNFVPSSSTLYRNITDRNVTSYTVFNLLALTKYYFKIRVVDEENAFADSKELSGTTTIPVGPDVPQPVDIFDPTDAEIFETQVNIRWESYQNPEFKAYEVHYSIDPSFIPSSSTRYMGQITIPTINSVPVSNLMPSTNYYFVVRVVNVKDKFSDSRKVSARTK
jgi:hypothetical protein